ncbi:hypothetical protein Dimus_028022 [Dionaea muscipula]
MAAPPLLRGLPLLRLRLHNHRHAVGLFTPLRRPACTAATESTRSEERPLSAEEAVHFLRVKEPPKYHRIDEPDFGKWRYKQKEILRDIEPITLLVKEILHSGRYIDGERLNAEDERAVVEKLLTYHPCSEDKIGCGLDSIMVDRHPLFRQTRCLFVVRTDGGWIDFSYQKCLREYIRTKYPAHAEKFIRAHLGRGRD